jgi:hypothetical protein
MAIQMTSILFGHSNHLGDKPMANWAEQAHGERMLEHGPSANLFANQGSASTGLMTDKPLDLDKHRGMAAQKATDIRRILLDVENNAKDQRDREAILEGQLLSVPAASWPEAAAKARYVLNLYAAGLAAGDTHHRDLVATVLADLARLSGEG